MVGTFLRKLYDWTVCFLLAFKNISLLPLFFTIIKRKKTTKPKNASFCCLFHTHLVNWFSYYRMMMVTKATRFLSFDFHCGTLKTIIQIRYKRGQNTDKILLSLQVKAWIATDSANQLLSRVSSYCLMNKTFGEPKCS